MPTPLDTHRPTAGVQPDPKVARQMPRSMAWAELSIMEAKQMSAEAMRIVAQSRDVCRRSSDTADKPPA